MNIDIIDLSESQVEELKNAQDAYDKKHITYKINGSISIGISHEGTLGAGLDACMTAFKILYVSSVYVDEKYRRKGYGKDFYQAMHYEQAGHYKNDMDNYQEYFFVKRI